MSKLETVFQMILLMITPLGIGIGYFMFTLSFAGSDTSATLGAWMIVGGGLLLMTLWLNLHSHYDDIPLHLFRLSAWR